jgi:hypothetical protein
MNLLLLHQLQLFLLPQLHPQIIVQIIPTKFTQDTNDLYTLVHCGLFPLQSSVGQEGSHDTQVGVAEGFLFLGQVPQFADDNIHQDVEVVCVEKVVQCLLWRCEQQVQQLQN